MTSSPLIVSRLPVGSYENDFRSSRQHLIDAVEKALTRLGTDYIDLFQLHGQDYNTPAEETLATLVRSGNIRYIGGSNFSGWHLMKSLAVSVTDTNTRGMLRSKCTTLHSVETTNRN